MTDFFALFDQPRQPWIEPDQLEQKYRELARRTHPDQLVRSSNEFAEVNDAYRTLRDPKLRLEHLLALEGVSPSTSPVQAPADLANLFMKLAPAVANRNKERVDALTQELCNHYEEALTQLHRLNDAWSKKLISRMKTTEDLYRRFAFLSRWRQLLEEHQFNLATDRQE